jgi:hypothetical protein
VATITNCWKILRHCLVRDVDLERLCTWVVILGAKSSDRPRLPCHDANTWRKQAAGRVLGLVRTTATHSIAEAAHLWPGRADVGIFFERGGELALKKRSHDRFAERKYNTCVPPKVFAAAAFKLFSCTLTWAASLAASCPTWCFPARAVSYHWCSPLLLLSGRILWPSCKQYGTTWRIARSLHRKKQHVIVPHVVVSVLVLLRPSAHRGSATGRAFQPCLVLRRLTLLFPSSSPSSRPSSRFPSFLAFVVGLGALSGF